MSRDKIASDDSNLTKKTLAGAGWSGGASMLRLVLKVFSVAILARLLSPQDYGVVGGGLLVIYFCSMLYRIGAGQVLIQRTELSKEHISTALFVSLSLAFLISILIWLAAPYIANFMFINELKNVVRVLALTILFGSFNTICEALLARNMQFRDLALRPLITFCFAAFFVAIPLAYSNFGYWSLVAMELAEVLVSAIVFGYSARNQLVFPRFNRAAFHELWGQSLRFAANEPFYFLANYAPQFIIARQMGAEFLGLYTRSSFIVENANILFNNISRIVLFPALAKIKNDTERMCAAILRSTALIAVLAMPTSVFAFIFSGEITTVVLGSKWSDASVLLAVLIIALYPRLWLLAGGAILQAAGKPTGILLVNILIMLVLICAIPAVSMYGLTYVCAAIVAGSWVGFLAMIWLVGRTVELQMAAVIRVHIVPIGVSVGVFMIGVLVKKFLVPDSAIVAMLLAGFLSGIFCLAVINLIPTQVARLLELETLQKLSTNYYSVICKKLKSTE